MSAGVEISTVQVEVTPFSVVKQYSQIKKKNIFILIFCCQINVHVMQELMDLVHLSLVTSKQKV